LRHRDFDCRLAKAHWGYPEKWILSWTADLTITREYIESRPTFVALLGKQIVGFFVLHLRPTEASLDHLWVLPTEIGNGIGRALFAYAEKSCAKVVRRARKSKVIRTPKDFTSV